MQKKLTALSHELKPLFAQQYHGYALLSHYSLKQRTYDRTLLSNLRIFCEFFAALIKIRNGHVCYRDLL